MVEKKTVPNSTEKTSGGVLLEENRGAYPNESPKAKRLVIPVTEQDSRDVRELTQLYRAPSTAEAVRMAIRSSLGKEERGLDNNFQYRDLAKRLDRMEGGMTALVQIMKSQTQLLTRVITSPKVEKA